MENLFYHVKGKSHIFKIKLLNGETVSHCKVMECERNDVIGLDHLVLYKFRTEAAFQLKGYGKKLLKEVFENFNKDNRNLYLWVEQTNYKAICLYQSMGFKSIGRHPDASEYFTMLKELKE